MIYENASEQAAFDRWVDVMAELLLKYGPAWLKSVNKSDASATMTDSTPLQEQSSPLDDTPMAA